jgi:hypothetical protein
MKTQIDTLLGIRVETMQSPTGGDVPNQVILSTRDNGLRLFKSYGRSIALEEDGKPTLLDERYYDYSRTTAKYRNAFLNDTTDGVKRGIKSGEYILTDLNGAKYC